jgi:hypothetical protein
LAAEQQVLAGLADVRAFPLILHPLARAELTVIQARVRGLLVQDRPDQEHEQEQEVPAGGAARGSARGVPGGLGSGGLERVVDARPFHVVGAAFYRHRITAAATINTT